MRPFEPSPLRSNAGADAWLETIDLTGRNEIREDLADLGLGIVSGQIEMGQIVQAIMSLVAAPLFQLKDEPEGERRSSCGLRGIIA